MAEEFNLEQAVTEQEKAEGDREFYKAFIGQQHIASPLASYLYGAANAKYASMKGKLYAEKTQYERDRQARKDAEEAKDKADNMAYKYQTSMLGVAKDVAAGNISPKAGAAFIAKMMPESGVGTPVDFDEATNMFRYKPTGSEEVKEFDLKDLGDSLRQEKIATEQARQDYYKAMAQKAIRGGSGSGTKTNQDFTKWENATKELRTDLGSSGSRPSEARLERYTPEQLATFISIPKTATEEQKEIYNPQIEVAKKVLMKKLGNNEEEYNRLLGLVNQSSEEDDSVDEEEQQEVQNVGRFKLTVVSKEARKE